MFSSPLLVSYRTTGHLPTQIPSLLCLGSNIIYHGALPGWCFPYSVLALKPHVGCLLRHWITGSTYPERKETHKVSPYLSWFLIGDNFMTMDLWARVQTRHGDSIVLRNRDQSSWKMKQLKYTGQGEIKSTRNCKYLGTYEKFFIFNFLKRETFEKWK